MSARGAALVLVTLVGVLSSGVSSLPAAGDPKPAAGRVEVRSERTEDSQTFANPDGSFTLVTSAVPTRARRNGVWVDFDPTLRRSADGLIRPKATAMDMAFSGGGKDPLVRLGYDGEQLSLSWPYPLPEPILERDSLRYPSVLPDVDLRITVNSTTFSEVLIVRTPKAAEQLKEIQFGIDAPGLTVGPLAGGGMQAVDGTGRKVFTAPLPAMWDSSGDLKSTGRRGDRGVSPLDGDGIAYMNTDVTQRSLTIVPSMEFLRDPRTMFPVYLDPSIAPPQSGRAMINQHFPTTASWNWTGSEGVGYQDFEPRSRKRLFFQFWIGKIPGASITSATFSAFQSWAGSCTPTEVQAWDTVKFGSGVNWNVGSGSNVWLRKLSSVVAAHGRDGCDPGGKWLSFPVTAAVQRRSAERGGYVYLGLRAADEANEFAWKRFNPNVQLSVTYNYPPSVLSRRLESPAVSCVTDPTRAPVIGESDPIPTIEIKEPDKTNVFAEFEVNLTGESLPRYRGTSATKNPANGADFQPQTPLWDQVFDRPLLTNRVWAWRARANDGVAASPWTTWCYFMIDTTHPPAPKITVVTPGPYEIGHAITVRLEPNGATDVTGYKLGVNDNVPQTGTISPSSPTYTFTPSTFGPLALYGWSFDRAQNQSNGARIAIRIGNAPEIGKWLMDEGSGVTLADSSGRNHPMNLSQEVRWNWGNRAPDDPNDWAVTMNGLGGTWGQTQASDVVNSNQNFTVTARVKVGTRSLRQAAVSEDRPGLAGFTLGVFRQTWDAEGDDRHIEWEFAIPDPDGSGEITARTEPLPYLPGDWVHLAGTYDAAGDTIKLYVDRMPPEVTAIPGGRTPLDGAGPLKIGHGITGGAVGNYFLGQIEDVRVYGGAVDESTVDVLVENVQG